MIKLYVSPTGLDCGNSFISIGLAATMQSLGYKTGIYKPIQLGVTMRNGFAQSFEAAFINKIDSFLKFSSTYNFRNEVTPVIASELENTIIDKYVIKREFEEFSATLDCSVIDGTGGLLEPISPQNTFNKDIIKLLDMPVVFVINPKYGTESSSILSLNSAVDYGINVRGVIINDYPLSDAGVVEKTFPRIIEEYSGAKILGLIRHFDSINQLTPSDMITNILNGIDIESVFGVNIAKLQIS
jgi:dethiobiotin synthetase